MRASFFRACAIRAGVAMSSATSAFSSASLSTPRARPSASARQAKTASWQVKALVEATPISGPARIGAAISLSARWWRCRR